MDKIVIEVAKPSDSAKLLEIYAPYVCETAISFEYDVPTVEEFKTRIENTLRRYPYFVARKNGEIIGYAYAGVFKEREAYSRCVETTVYVKQNSKKQGIGKALYCALEKALKMQNIINLNACIAYSDNDDEYLTKNSVQFHEHIGYSYVGRFHNCGYKFDRWYDMVWMEKMISDHLENPLPVKTFPEIKDEFYIK